MDRQIDIFLKFVMFLGFINTKISNSYKLLSLSKLHFSIKHLISNLGTCHSVNFRKNINDKNMLKKKGR